MIIPWRVDVPQERWPLTNWLIIIGAIAAFVFQTISVIEQKAKLPDKLKEFENHSVEDVAKELGVSEQQLKEIEQTVEEAYDKIEKAFPKKASLADSKEFKDKIVKKTMLKRYFVWGKVRPFVLDGCKIKGLFGHIWLHGGLIHLLGNLLFLWIFGNAVCAKIGNLLYAFFYLGAGILAGIAHLIFGGGSMIGASGAINGVVGMYLVFFASNAITCYWIWFPLYFREFEVASFWMILFWLAFDIFGATMGGGAVAYFAHLGGFAIGFAVGIVLLKTGAVKMERWESSLLDIWGRKSGDDKTVSGEKYNRDLRMLEMMERNEQQKVVEEAPKPKQSLAVDDFFRTEPKQEEFIRFFCECGKRIKVARKYAGKTGMCPKCHKRIKVPESN